MHRRDFDGFYGLRYLSILVILVAHTFMIECRFSNCLPGYEHVQALGQFALQFFFVASAFLITFLLLAEEERRGSISIRHFFLRRALRIWPAYFLLLLIVFGLVHRMSFFNIPEISEQFAANDPGRCRTLYFLFLPHIVPFYNNDVPYLHHTWTIGIEEQFYFAWGLLFLLVRRGRAALFAGLFLAMPLVGLLHSWLIAEPRTGSALWLQKGITWLEYSRVSTFALGAFLGYAYHRQKRWLGHFRSRSVQLLVYALILAATVFPPSWHTGFNECVALVAGALMLIASFPKESLIPYNRRWLVHLGHRSYGIYLFHLIAVVVASKASSALGLAPGIGRFLVVAVLAIAIATGMGWACYDGFEKFFLRVKNRFREV